jgi:hypothetical protein
MAGSGRKIARRNGAWISRFYRPMPRGAGVAAETFVFLVPRGFHARGLAQLSQRDNLDRESK